MSQATMLIEEVMRPVERRAPAIQGLCRDCVNAEACTFPRDPSQPVRSCDEFTPTTLARDRHAPFVMAMPVYPIIRERAPDPEELRGLCRQCANRITCTFPKPPEGVWQCDELA